MTILIRETSSNRACCLWNICSAFQVPRIAKEARKWNLQEWLISKPLRADQRQGTELFFERKHPQQHPHPAGLSVAARQPLGDVWVSDVRGEARCCSWLSAPLRVRGTGRSPPNPLVILYSLKLCQQILPQASLQNCEERLKGSRGQHAVQSSLFR